MITEVREGVKHMLREQRQRKANDAPSWNVPMILEGYWTLVTKPVIDDIYGVDLNASPTTT